MFGQCFPQSAGFAPQPGLVVGQFPDHAIELAEMVLEVRDFFFQTDQPIRRGRFHGRHSSRLVLPRLAGGWVLTAFPEKTIVSFGAWLRQWSGPNRVRFAERLGLSALRPLSSPAASEFKRLESSYGRRIRSEYR